MNFVRFNLFILIILSLVFVSCSQIKPDLINDSVNELSPYEGKTVFFVDSYHEGYDWSDDLTLGIKEVLEGKGINLIIYRLDTKNNPQEEFILNAVLKAKNEIDEVKPDVLIVTDDNAFNYLAQKYYRNVDMPVVYAGLNWDSSVYGLPYNNSAGMVEVSLTIEVVEKLKRYTTQKKVGYISADSFTERKVWENYEKLGISKIFEKVYWPKTIPEFKEQFLALQDEVDIIFIENVVGLKNWSVNQEANELDLKEFIQTNIAVPTGGLYIWTEDYCLLQLQKMPYEQGEYAALTALKILDGVNPSQIPEVTNKEGVLVLNFNLAEKLNISFDPSLLRNARIND